MIARIPVSLARADSSEAQSLYDEWASAYDGDNGALSYSSPQRSVEAISKNVAPTASETLRIFDTGCGTGLVSECLAKSSFAGRFILDDVDFSDGMMKVARQKGFYRELEMANLDESIGKSAASYGIVVCVRTLMKGYVGPSVFAEFARLADKSGLIVATVHEKVWVSGGYKTEIEELHDLGVIYIVSTDEFDIPEEANTVGRMVALRKKQRESVSSKDMDMSYVYRIRRITVLCE